MPMLYALNGADADPRLGELLAGPLDGDDEVTEALRRLRESEGLVRARRTLDEHAERARTELTSLPDCPARDAVSSLVDYVVARTW